jgi:hypothetical protein
MAYEPVVAPHITTDLVDQSINAGETATFVVAATGTAPLSYRWYVDDSWISAAVGPSLQTTTAGQYYVVVEDANGQTVQSKIVTLTVNSQPPPVTITTPLAGATLTGTNTVVASAPDATTVEFWVDGARRFTNNSSPFSWAWDTTMDTDGSHQIVAKAYSGTTLLGFTSPLAVTVANHAAYSGPDREHSHGIR